MRCNRAKLQYMNNNWMNIRFQAFFHSRKMVFQLCIETCCYSFFNWTKTFQIAYNWLALILNAFIDDSIIPYIACSNIRRKRYATIVKILFLHTQVLSFYRLFPYINLYENTTQHYIFTPTTLHFKFRANSPLFHSKGMCRFDYQKKFAYECLSMVRQ